MRAAGVIAPPESVARTATLFVARPETLALVTNGSARSRGKLVKRYDLKAAEMARLKNHEPAPVRIYFAPCPACRRPHHRAEPRPR
jgi:hypothetical protein